MPIAPDQLQLAAVRSDGKESISTQIYHIRELGWDIIIESEEEHGTVQLSGQLLTNDLLEDGTFQVRLLNDDTLVTTTSIDDFGTFSFVSTDYHSVTLCVHTDDLEIYLPYVLCG